MMMVMILAILMVVIVLFISASESSHITEIKVWNLTKDYFASEKDQYLQVPFGPLPVPNLHLPISASRLEYTDFFIFLSSIEARTVGWNLF